MWQCILANPLFYVSGNMTHGNPAGFSTVKINNKEVKAVIFDLDGTLYERKGLMLRLILKDLVNWKLFWSLHKSREYLKGKNAGSVDGLYTELFQKMASVSKKSPLFIEKWYRERFYISFIKVLKSSFSKRKKIDDVLSRLNNSGIALAVLSDYSHVQPRLESLAIETDYFALVTSGEDLGALKPNKELFLSVANSLQVSPSKILVVGDRDEMDGEGARRAGMQFLLIGEKQKNGSVSWDRFAADVLSSDFYVLQGGIEDSSKNNTGLDSNL